MDDSSVSDAQRVIRFLVENARCGECGSEYRAEDVYVLDQLSQRIWELAAVCPSCLSVWLVKAVVHADARAVAARHAAPAPGMHEMTPAEERHFSDLDPVSADDVLDVCEFLSSFDGDFRAYFGRDPDGL